MRRRITFAIVGAVIAALVIAGAGTFVLDRLSARETTRRELERQSQSLIAILDETILFRTTAPTTVVARQAEIRQVINRIKGLSNLSEEDIGILVGTSLEKLEGTYPYTIERSVKAFRLNRFLHELVNPAFRKQFLADPTPLYEQHKLTAEERDLVTRRDWRALIHYGVIFFLLEKLGAVVGTTNLHIYAAMRGQSLEDFQKTRNAQVLYSVAGTDEGKKDWDKKPAARA